MIMSKLLTIILLALCTGTWCVGLLKAHAEFRRNQAVDASALDVSRGPLANPENLGTPTKAGESVRRPISA